MGNGNSIKIMARCISPFIKDGIELPCGKCYPCKERRISGWSFRLQIEAERSCSALFVTLTYDTDQVPITSNGFMTLAKKDLQNWFKTHRKFDTRNKIKYYAVGEYGGKTDRPHYHVIMFNADKEWIPLTWNKGSVFIGDLTPASAAYTLKYISKQSRIPKHKNDDRIPEFSLMSKKLGDNYINPAQIKWHKADKTKRLYIGLKDGKKIAMPRYYKDKIYSNAEKLYINLQIQKQITTDYQKLSEQKKLAKDKKDSQLRIGYASKNKDNRNQTF